MKPKTSRTPAHATDWSVTDVIYEDLDDLIARELSELTRGKIDQVLKTVIERGGIQALLSGRTKIVHSNPANVGPLSVMENFSLGSDDAKIFRGELGSICATREILLDKDRKNIKDLTDQYGERIVFPSIPDVEATISDLLLRYNSGYRPDLQQSTIVFLVWVDDKIFFAEIKFNDLGNGAWMNVGNYDCTFKQGTRLCCYERISQ